MHLCWQLWIHVDSCALLLTAVLFLLTVVSLYLVVLSCWQLYPYVYSYALMLAIVSSYWYLCPHIDLCTIMLSCTLMLTVMSCWQLCPHIELCHVYNHALMLTVMVTDVDRCASRFTVGTLMLIVVVLIATVVP